jgi:hypothetical protein
VTDKCTLEFSSDASYKATGKTVSDSRVRNYRVPHLVPVWNPDAAVDLGAAGFGVHTGFFGSKSAHGIFEASVNITNCGGCSWGDVSGQLYETLGLIYNCAYSSLTKD